MSDFIRVLNVIIIIAVVAYLYKAGPWRKKKTSLEAGKAEKLNDLRNDKAKLAQALSAYDDDLERFAQESREMLDEFFTCHEAKVKEMVRQEINAALDELEAETRVEMEQSFETAKIELESRFNENK